MTEPLYRKVQKGKTVRYEPIAVPDGQALPMNDQSKAMTLHIALAAMESVMLQEKPKSARYTRVSRGIDTVLELVDIYRIEAWPAAEICKAGDLVDEFNARISMVFGV